MVFSGFFQVPAKRLFPFFCFCVLCFSGVAFSATKPLLISGKQALFQRVLSLPGGLLFKRLGGSSYQPVVPFSAFYVYSRRSLHSGAWLQVGTGRHGKVAGWLRAADVLEWNQGLTVAFREPVLHDRALLFKSADALLSVVSQPDLADYQSFYQAALVGDKPADSPVVAIQPPGKLDIRKNFYLVPIRDHRDIFIGAERARMLQVASVPLLSDTQAALPAMPAIATPPPAVQAPVAQPVYRAGIVFAVDATLSMQPFINRTRLAVRQIYDTLDMANLLGNVNFGLVAFRDAPEVAPGLDFRARTVVDLPEGRDPDVFLNRVLDLQAATVSSQDAVEDVFAGLHQAIVSLDWSGHAARYIVLVTDAGPRGSDDPLSGTGLDAEALRALALEKGIAIFVLHLLSDKNAADHAKDAATYQALSDFPGVGSLYYGVPTGDVREFGVVLDSVAAQIARQVQAIVEVSSKPVEVPAVAVPAPMPSQLDTLQSKVERLGYALQLRFLQNVPEVPRVFNAWLLDRDIRNPELRTLDVQVLLSRDQLSDLHDVLSQVLQTAEEGLLSPQSFLNELKSLAATIARDPSQLGSTTATTAGAGGSLADLGFMREYIADLPYAGEVMNLSLEDWDLWSAAQQIDFLHRLEQKIAYYRSLHDHTDAWISLDNGPIDGDSVFPVPLEMLP